MAFAYTIIHRQVSGDRMIVYGTFTCSGGGTGGDIKTGLRVVENMKLQHTGSSVISDVPVVNESFPLAGGDVTIVTVADKVGTWEARGRP